MAKRGILGSYISSNWGIRPFLSIFIESTSEDRKEKDNFLVCENVMLKCVFGIPLSFESLVCVDTGKRAVRLNMEMARKISVRNPRKTPVKKENPKRGGAIHLRILSAFSVPRCTVLLDSGQQKMSGKIGLYSK